MSTETQAGPRPRTDGEGPTTENDSGCYYCNNRAVGIEVVDGDETRRVCYEHAPTEGGADE